MKMKEQSEKVALKLRIQKTNIMASGPITSWQINGGKMDTMTDSTFSGSQITEDSDCSCEIKTLAPWKRSCDRPRQCIKKQRNHFADKDPYSRIYSFPVVMYG